jgi:Tfp pilus assembly protein FimT
MTTIAIVVVLLTLAIPSFTTFIARQRVRSITSELVHDMQYARSEAIQRKRPVYLSFGTAPNGEACYHLYVTLNPGVICNSCGFGSAPCQMTIALKDVSVPTSISFSTSPSVDATAHRGRIDFYPERLAVASAPDLTMVDPVTWNVLVASSVSGKLTMTIDATGQSHVCSPDSSISGAATCPSPSP